MDGSYGAPKLRADLRFRRGWSHKPASKGSFPYSAVSRSLTRRLRVTTNLVPQGGGAPASLCVKSDGTMDFRPEQQQEECHPRAPLS